MIFAVLVFIGLIGLVVAGLRLHTAIESANHRFRGFTSGHREAVELVASRRRFRQRQQRVESALDTGTAGIQTAHRALSGLFGAKRDRGAGVYDSVRAFNHGAGRAVSSLFAPTPEQRVERISNPPRTDDNDEGTNQSST